jgi:hypothetical protein
LGCPGLADEQRRPRTQTQSMNAAVAFLHRYGACGHPRGLFGVDTTCRTHTFSKTVPGGLGRW